MKIGDSVGMQIVMISDRPDLVPIVADWLWSEFWQHDGYTFEDTRATVAASTAPIGPSQTFILIVNGQPVGTASLAADDLDERPDLTPWLAGVFVIPEVRGRGYATTLIAAVERACRTASILTAWLYTNTAESLYKHAGWQVAEIVEREGKHPVTLMRREF